MTMSDSDTAMVAEHLNPSRRQASTGTLQRGSTGIMLRETFSLAKSLCGLVLVSLYAYICDRTNIFVSFPKAFETETACIYAIIMLSFIITFRENKNQSNLEEIGEDQVFSIRKVPFIQTDEWKGWMQMSLLFYHYLFPAPQPLYVYIGARVLVASFLFMTGYGQTMKALKTDCQFHTIELVLTFIRLNLLVFFLCIFMNRRYGDYYFAPLVTFWSVFIYLLHTAVLKKFPSLRFAIAFLICACLSFNSSRDPALPSFARMVFGPISWLVSSRTTPLDTWLFRLQLDCFSPLLGSMLAWYSRTAAINVRALQNSALFSSNLAGGVVATILVAISTSAVLVNIAALSQRSQDRALACVALCDDCKTCAACRNAAANASSTDLAGCAANRLAQEEYNLRVHPVLCLVATLTFLAARNSLAWLRRRASQAAALAGRHSLELYVLQYHVWLAADAKRILVALPGRPALNAAVLGAGFILAAAAARASTAAAMAATERALEAAAPGLARRSRPAQGAAGGRVPQGAAAPDS
jgi:N-acetylneuraminate 9-O-acetyltransferase